MIATKLVVYDKKNRSPLSLDARNEKKLKKRDVRYSHFYLENFANFIINKNIHRVFKKRPHVIKQITYGFIKDNHNFYRNKKIMTIQKLVNDNIKDEISQWIHEWDEFKPNMENFSHSRMKLLKNNENLLSIYSNISHSDSTNYNESLLKKDRVPFYKIITHGFYKANKIFQTKGGKYAR